jgi:hypothetical protein
VTWQQIAEDVFRRWLIEVVDGRTRPFTFLLCRLTLEPRDRQQPLDDDPLGHHRLELVIDEIDARCRAGGEILDGGIRNINRVGKRHLLKDADRFITDVESTTTEEVASFPTDQAEGNVASRCFVEDELSGRFDDVGIEAAAQTAVRRDDNQQRTPGTLRRKTKQRMRILIDARDQTVQHLQHPLGERARRNHPILRAFQPGRGDHLHRLGDLLRRLDRADPAPEIDQ